MTLNLAIVSPGYAICVADRRLSSTSGVVVSERGNKLTAFNCADAAGFITYNGIGQDEARQSPNDWIANNTLLPRLPLELLAKAIKADADKRLAALAAKGFDARHSFLLNGFLGDAPFICMISNYESLDQDGHLAHAKSEMEIGFLIGQRDEARVSMICTGNLPVELKGRAKALREKGLKGATPADLRSAMVKVVRDAAYSQDLKGSVGSSVLSGILIPGQGFETSSHAVGGETILESPNFITPEFSFRDMYVDIAPPEKGDGFRYNRATGQALIREPRCRSCGNPFPEGNRKCLKCGAAR